MLGTWKFIKVCFKLALISDRDLQRAYKKPTNFENKPLKAPLGACLLLVTSSFIPLSCTKSSQDKATLPEPKQISEATTGENAVAHAQVPVQEAKETDLTATSVAASDLSQNTASNTEVKLLSEVSAASEAENQYRLVGEVTALRKSQMAFKVAGFIETIDVKPGVTVKKGGVLAKLEGRDFKLRFDLAKIRRDQARLAFDNAGRELKRETELKEQNASTESNFDRIKSAYDQAQLSFQIAEIDLKNAENAFLDSKLVAPYDCVVATQLKYEGESVQSGTAVFEVFDVTNLELTLRAPEKLLGQLKMGEVMTVKVPSAGYSGSAKIVRIVPIVNEKTRTFNVTAQFDKVDPVLVPGLFAEALIKRQPRTKQ